MICTPAPSIKTRLVTQPSWFQVGFADPRTLSSTGAGRLMPDGSISFAPSLEYAPGAIQTFAPTCMAAVPKIWDILKKGIEQTISAGPAPVRFLFETAFLAVKYNAPYRPSSALTCSSLPLPLPGR